MPFHWRKGAIRLHQMILVNLVTAIFWWILKSHAKILILDLSINEKPTVFLSNVLT